MGGGKDILFEKFEIIECLKKDVGACVYVAYHIYLGKKILLKTLDRSTIADPAMLKRFQREARTLARLDHENIIKVLDFGTFNEFFYISFEYFPGRNLRSIVKDDAATPEQKKDIFIQIVKGVAFAHKHGIVHRDLKPENILVDDNNHVKVADFGLALVEGEESLTAQTSIVGTPGYMSPEQIRGEKLTPQSDLFSLGVVGYELFTGVNPFLGKDAGATLHNILSPQSRLDRLDAIPQPFAELLRRMLQKSKSARMRSVQEALDRLGESHGRDSSAAAAVSGAKPMKVWMTISGFILLAVVVIFSLIFERSQPEPLESNATLYRNNPEPSGEQPPLVDQQKQDSVIESSSIKKSENRKPVSADLALQNVPGRLLIRCTPWAHVYVDSIKIDTTPMEEAAALTPGEHRIRLQHPNFPTYMKKIRINPGQEVVIAVDLDTLFGYFSCNIFPWGDVYIDGDFKGQTPFAGALAVAPGNHALVVKNQQYGSVEDVFSVARRDTFHYRLNFEQPVGEDDSIR